jgi:4-hydroxybenzoate polyprenyltransferase
VGSTEWRRVSPNRDHGFTLAKRVTVGSSPRTNVFANTLLTRQGRSRVRTQESSALELSSETPLAPSTLRHSIRSHLIYLLKASRPGFWLTAVWFYMFPLAQQEVASSALFWIGLGFVTFPLGLVIYGLNDLMDRETDRLNDRKGGFLFGPQGTDRQLRLVPWAVLLVHLPLMTWLGFRFGTKALLWYGVLAASVAFYNAPKIGFKNWPFLDLLNQASYLLVFYFSSLINSAASLPWRSQLFGVLFAMHSHLLGQIMDVAPDRAAGRRTTAVVVGPIAAKLILALFLVAESFLVNRVFASTLATLGWVWSRGSIVTH